MQINLPTVAAAETVLPTISVEDLIALVDVVRQSVPTCFTGDPVTVLVASAATRQTLDAVTANMVTAITSNDVVTREAFAKMSRRQLATLLYSTLRTLSHDGLHTSAKLREDINPIFDIVLNVQSGNFMFY